MLVVERSNRTERLLEGLADRLMAPGRDPLAPAVVVVQGPGMERWLAQSIARRHGVCANTAFVFPRELLDRIFRSLPDDRAAPTNPAWERNRLVWSVARLLAAHRGDPDFAPLARHLDAPDGDWRLLQLARQIADLIDRTITFRPEWIERWCTTTDTPVDRDERWQARLVRMLRDRLGPGHLADRARQLLEVAGATNSADRGRLEAGLAQQLPDRVEIFAVSTLPPLMLSVIDGLARLRDVHLSVLSPSESYWADLWREVRDADLAAEQAVASDPEASDLFAAVPATPAARLLAGLGRLGGDFQRALEEHMSPPEQDLECFESPIEAGGEATLLARLQADLLSLAPLEETSAVEGSVDPGRIVRCDDDSIQVHLCHGPRRELEVVEAALHDAFERDETLAPEDVIVMAPRIDEIAADIEAVFGVPHEDGRAIPFRIADRGAFQRSLVAETFRGLLDLLGGRVGRSEVFDWLAREPARARFGLDEETVERLSEWAARAGIRFGLDAAHRADLGLAQDPAHSWSDGLARLALAHAVGASGEVFEGLAAEPLDPWASPEALGAIGEIESMLRAARARIGAPMPVASWCGWLRELLAAGCARDDSNAHEHASIRGALVEIAESAAAAGFDRPVPFQAIRERVSEALEASPAPQAFLAGGVTFCELVPLRAIPFRVVVILGLSDPAFPRGGPAPGFDLIARSPRPGDRNARVDDRYLFLEALLSARDRLILTVPGRDMRDGSDLPPSIVVAELLDAIEGSFVVETPTDGTAFGSLREQIIVRHPLQSSSPRYFETPDDPRLLGRDEEAFAAARARRAAIEAGGGVARRFLTRPAAPTRTDSTPPRLSLDDLVVRVLQATRYFTRERLRLRVPRLEEDTADLDPYELDPLEQYALGSAMLADLEAGVAEPVALRRLRAHASIPSGLPGALAVRSLQEEVGRVAQIARARRSGERLADLETEITLEVEGLGSCVLGGRLDQLWPDGRVEVSFGRIGRRSELGVWIRHLFLCACLEAGVDAGDRSFAPRSVFVGRGAQRGSSEQVVIFGPDPEPGAHLAQIFEWAWSCERAPLPLFPASSLAFAKPALEHKTDQAWRAAQQSYLGGESNHGTRPESEQDLEQARLWEGVSPLEASGDPALLHRFDHVATGFFGPMLAVRKTDSA